MLSEAVRLHHSSLESNNNNNNNDNDNHAVDTDNYGEEDENNTNKRYGKTNIINVLTKCCSDVDPSTRKFACFASMKLHLLTPSCILRRSVN